MSRHALNVSGQKFGLLTAIKSLGKRGTKFYWQFQCDCGTITNTRLTSVISGSIRSCGCERVKSNTRHGHTASAKSFEYRSWQGMKDRCTNPNNPRWHRYGGRGITYCSRWELFENFFADMGERPHDLSLERKDNDGNYEPSNCKWATAKEQANNRYDNKRPTEAKQRALILADL